MKNQYLSRQWGWLAWFSLVLLSGSHSSIWAQCTPISATVCASGDDVTTIYVGGQLIGTFPYVGAPGTNQAGNPTCMTVPTALLTGSQVCLAVATQNTAPQNTFSSWDLDITCSGGQHSEITSSGIGISNDYVAGCNPCAPPANDGSSNPWYATNYTGTAFSSTFCSGGVTTPTWANGVFDPTTGIQIPFISNNCSGDYGTSDGANYWRQFTTIPAPTTLVGSPALTISKSQTSMGIIGQDMAITYQIIVCNTGGPVTSGGVTVSDNFLVNSATNGNSFQFGCFGYQGSLCNYSGFYGQIPISGSGNNPMVFSYFPNGCVTLSAAVSNYYYCTTCNPSVCVTLVDQAVVSWTGSGQSSNAITFAATCQPTFTPSDTPTNSPTGTLTPLTPTATPTLTSTASPTPSATASPTSSITPLTSTPISSPTGTFTKTPTTTPTWTFTLTSSPTGTVTPSPPTPSPTSTFSATPTDSPTWTYTSTAVISSTSTPVPTSTPTPTPTYSNTVKFWPNPIKGTYFTLLPPPYSGVGNIHVVLYSIGFRKVLDEVFPAVPSGTPITVYLFDKYGNQLGNGLYFLVVTTPAGKYVEKLLVLQ